MSLNYHIFIQFSDGKYSSNVVLKAHPFEVISPILGRSKLAGNRFFSAKLRIMVLKLKQNIIFFMFAVVQVKSKFHLCICSFISMYLFMLCTFKPRREAGDV